MLGLLDTAGSYRQGGVGVMAGNGFCTWRRRPVNCRA